VHGVLRERILSLELAPGTRLYESELARELEVSRTPLREALRMLLAEDLVLQQPTGGMVVRPLDQHDMRELYAVRAALEGLLVREACDRLTESDQAEMAALLDQMRLLVDHPGDLLRVGRQFHDRFARVSGNRRGQQLLRQIQGQVGRYQVLTNRQSPRRRETLDEHRGIFEAAVARDGELAERRMREHILAAYRTAAAALDIPATIPEPAPTGSG
jgi:DNA-binding GntR family transcriptional regulator